MILLIGLLGGGYKLYDFHRQNKSLNGLVTENISRQEKLKASNDSISRAMVAKDSVINDMQQRISKLGQSAGSIPSAPKTRVRSVDNNALRSCDRNVFFVVSLGFEIILPNGETYELECGEKNGLPVWTGTGFLLDDGRFVTARHVVEPWYFHASDDDEESMTMLNAIAHNGGKVIAHLGAVSSSGDHFTFKSTDCNVSRYGDKTQSLSDGKRIVVASPNGKDFATIHVGKPGGLRYDSNASRYLERGTKLTILGFPLGLGASSEGISPIYGSAVVAADGLQNGVILTTEATYEQGSSGGPVFYTDINGNLIVIGITSAYAGRSTGLIVPISSIN